MKAIIIAILLVSYTLQGNVKEGSSKQIQQGKQVREAARELITSVVQSAANSEHANAIDRGLILEAGHTGGNNAQQANIRRPAGEAGVVNHWNDNDWGNDWNDNDGRNDWSDDDGRNDWNDNDGGNDWSDNDNDDGDY